MGWLPGPINALVSCVPIYARNWVSFFLLGLINNFAYVVINSSADDLVVLFKKQNLVRSVRLDHAHFDRSVLSCGATSSLVSLRAVRPSVAALADAHSGQHILYARLVIFNEDMDHYDAILRGHRWCRPLCLRGLLVLPRLHRPHRLWILVGREVRT